ncbi:Rieske 2Fe-2S domain-containing protein [Helicobacter sp. 23-1045]
MKIANVSELKDGVNEVFCGGKKYFIYKNGAEIKVYSAVCPHQGAILCFDNSSLGNHCVDFQNFGASQTASLVSRPKTKFPRKFRKNSTSTTANTRIDSKENADSAIQTKNAESNENIAESALDSAPHNEIYCKVHNWRFCAKSGEATNVKNASLSEVAFRIDDLGDIYLDSANFAESFTKNPPPPVAKIRKIPYFRRIPQFHKIQKIRQISA